MRYLVAIEEWNYPCESGREFVDTYSLGEGQADECKLARLKAKEMCENERMNFSAVTNTDPLMPNLFEDGSGTGYIITPKNGLDDWYYAVRLIEVSSLH